MNTFIVGFVAALVLILTVLFFVVAIAGVMKVVKDNNKELNDKIETVRIEISKIKQEMRNNNVVSLLKK